MNARTPILFSLLILFCILPQPNFAEDWKRVFLATYPRSGNHWIRYLVEEATLTATGSVYCDNIPPHLKKAFPWGGFACKNGYEGTRRYPKKGGRVLIKTHFPTFGKPTKFDLRPAVKTIRVVRHPVDSFYSFHIFKNKNFPPDALLPEHAVQNSIANWRNFQEHWNCQKNIVTFRYEDLFNNPAETLRKILAAAGFKVHASDIQRAVEKYPPEGKLLKHIHKFRHEDLVAISEQLKDLMDQFDYTIPLDEENEPQPASIENDKI